MDEQEKILCETPTPGKQGTRIAKWKYDAVRKAIRAVVPRSKDGVEARLLPKLVEKALPVHDLRLLGSVTWYTVTVKLHLEVLGELARVRNSQPQRIRLVR